MVCALIKLEFLFQYRRWGRRSADNGGARHIQHRACISYWNDIGDSREIIPTANRDSDYAPISVKYGTTTIAIVEGKCCLPSSSWPRLTTENPDRRRKVNCRWKSQNK